jgi:ATP-dependent RNA helicase DDX5/DBP2
MLGVFQRSSILQRCITHTTSRMFSMNIATTQLNEIYNENKGDSSSSSLPSSNSNVSDLELAEAKAFRTEHQISLRGVNVGENFIPMQSFEDTPYSAIIKRVFTKEGFNSPTHIQAQSWPIALAKRDMISIARTGSGKTCAFLLPAFHDIQINTSTLSDDEQDGTRRTRRAKAFGPGGHGGACMPDVVILAPTRELAVQIQEEAVKYSKNTGVRSIVAHGGGSQLRRTQALEMRRTRPNVLVATPGRCNDFIETGVINLSKVKYLVLDEADRMLDMGFLPQIETIIQSTPKERQTSLFSATWPAEVRELASEYLTNPVHLQVGNGELTANKKIKQNVIIVEKGRDKHAALMDLLKTICPSLSSQDDGNNRKPMNVPKMLIFRKTKYACDDMNYLLNDMGIRSEAIHGDKTQAQRNSILKRYRSNGLQVLIATDVASRGLDINDIEFVINYDCPDLVEDYVHRIGRTARGEASGVSYSFVTPAEKSFVRELVKVMKRSEQDISAELMEFVNQRNDRNGPNSNKRSKNWGRNNNKGSGFGGGNRDGFSGGGKRDGGYDRSDRRRANSWDNSSDTNNRRNSRSRGDDESFSGGGGGGGRSRSKSSSHNSNSYNRDKDSWGGGDRRGGDRRGGDRRSRDYSDDSNSW